MKKKILSFILCVCLIISILPIVASAEEYDLWVGGVRVTSENADNITGPGITLGEGGRVSFNADTEVLTLNNATITGYAVGVNYEQDCHGIYYDSWDPLTIELINDNVIVGPESQEGTYCIYAEDDIIFIGDGTLHATAGKSTSDGWSFVFGLYGEIIVRGKCEITAIADTYNEPSDVHAVAYCRGLTVGEDLEITVSNSATGSPTVAYDEDNLEDYQYIHIAPKVVEEPRYAISANVQSVNFGTATVGYADIDAKTITVTNDGNKTIDLAASSVTKFVIGAFSKNTIAPGESATFVVAPKAGLAAGTYNETIAVKSSDGKTNTVNISVSFIVEAQQATVAPTVTPTVAPTEAPTDAVTEVPTEVVTQEITPEVTVEATVEITEAATESANSQEPTSQPTQTPQEDEKSFPWIVVIIAAVVIVAGAVIIVVSKKKK